MDRVEIGQARVNPTKYEYQISGLVAKEGNTVVVNQEQPVPVDGFAGRSGNVPLLMKEHMFSGDSYYMIDPKHNQQLEKTIVGLSEQPNAEKFDALVKKHISSQKSQWTKEALESAEKTGEIARNGETHPGFMGNSLGNHLSLVQHNEVTQNGLKKRYAVVCNSGAVTLSHHFFGQLKQKSGMPLHKALNELKYNNYRRAAADNRRSVVKTFASDVLGLPGVKKEDITDTMSHDINVMDNGHVVFSQNALVPERSKYAHVVHFGSPMMPVAIMQSGHPYESSRIKALSPGHPSQDLRTTPNTKIGGADSECKVFGYHGKESTCFNELYEPSKGANFGDHARGDSKVSIEKNLWIPTVVVVKNT